HRADYEFGDGRIDFIRIYNSALTAQQIATIVPVKGDINGDGKFDGADVVALEKALANPAAAANLALGDFNGDGALTNADLQGMLLALKAGQGSSAAVPEPSSAVLLGANVCVCLWVVRRRWQFRTIK